MMLSMPPRLPAPVLSLGLQLVPILIFLLVDALVQDALWAIVAALAFVTLQALSSIVRRRKLDRFLLFDLALISGMGAASLLTRDELFFKLKPAVLEAVMVPYMLYLSLAPQRTLLAYFDRYSVGTRFDEARLPIVRRMLGLICVLVLLHAGLTALAALWWSKRTWGLISGPGFYAILVPLLGWSLLQRYRLKRLAREAEPTLSPARPLRARHRSRPDRPPT